MELRKQHFLRYLMGGAFNTLITYVIFLLLNLFINHLTAYSIVFAFGVILSYFINTYAVFRSKATLGNGIGFIWVCGFQYLFGLFTLNILTYLLGIPHAIAMAMVIAMNVPFTFFLLNFVFHREEK